MAQSLFSDLLVLIGIYVALAAVAVAFFRGAR